MPTTHGQSKRGKFTKAYRCWYNMKNRCTNKKSRDYKDYGGRGITVCSKWLNFEGFYDDIGFIGKGLTLDRIDNNKGYYKENCRLVSRKEQGRNRRSNNIVTFNGESLTLTEWSERTGIGFYTIRMRIHRSHWSIEKALTTPVKK